MNIFTFSISMSKMFSIFIYSHSLNKLFNQNSMQGKSAGLPDNISIIENLSK